MPSAAGLAAAESTLFHGMAAAPAVLPRGAAERPESGPLNAPRMQASATTKPAMDTIRYTHAPGKASAPGKIAVTVAWAFMSCTVTAKMDTTAPTSAVTSAAVPKRVSCASGRALETASTSIPSGTPLARLKPANPRGTMTEAHSGTSDIM